MDRRKILTWSGVGLLLLFCFLIPLWFPIWFSTHKVVHVVLMAGDGNVDGYARWSNLQDLLDGGNDTRFDHLRDSQQRNGTTTTTTRDNDHVFIVTQGRSRHDPYRMGPWNVYDYGAEPGLFGPEVEAGHVLGEAFEEPVVIIKTGYSDKSLYEDWISPSRVSAHPKKFPQLGYPWIHTLHDVKYALEQLDHHLLPKKFKNHRTQLLGIIWWHGYTDVLKTEWMSSYRENLVYLMQDFRIHFDRPHLPIVIAVAGAAGNKIDRFAYEPTLRKAQQEFCNEPQFREQSACVETHHYVHVPEDPNEQVSWRVDRPNHYYGRGDIMIEISSALADALVQLYFKQYSATETQQEMEANYDAYIERTQTKISLVLFLAIFLALFGVAAWRARNLNLFQWNSNRLFFISLRNPDHSGSKRRDRGGGGGRRRRRNHWNDEDDDDGDDNDDDDDEEEDSDEDDEDDEDDYDYEDEPSSEMTEMRPEKNNNRWSNQNDKYQSYDRVVVSPDNQHHDNDDDDDEGESDIVELEEMSSEEEDNGK